MKEKEDESLKLGFTDDREELGEGGSNMSIDVFNVTVCLNLLSMCCEGKSELAEMRCQGDIVDIHTAKELYENSGCLWPFKCCILKYISHCYLDSSSKTLFSDPDDPKSKSLRDIIKLVGLDMEIILN